MILRLKPESELHEKGERRIPWNCLPKSCHKGRSVLEYLFIACAFLVAGCGEIDLENDSEVDGLLEEASNLDDLPNWAKPEILYENIYQPQWLSLYYDYISFTHSEESANESEKELLEQYNLDLESWWKNHYPNGQPKFLLKRGVLELEDLDGPDGHTNPRFTVIGWEPNGERSETKLVSGTGILAIHHANGSLAVRKKYLDGLLHGQWISWYPNGVKREECHFEKGKIQGTWNAWHENGRKAKTLQCKLGLMEGDYLTWWPNGKMAKKLQFKGGKLLHGVGWNSIGEKDLTKVVDGNGTINSWAGDQAILLEIRNGANLRAMGNIPASGEKIQ